MAWVLVILLSAAIFGITYYVQSTKKKELISEGKMIERKSSFYEESELFTTSASYEDMLKAVSQQDFSDLKVSVTPNVEGKRIILFRSGYSWNAQLSDYGQKDGKNLLRFSFSAWRQRNGSPYNINSMNMMVTRIEKMVLSIDPSATVENHKMQTKTLLILLKV